jgi:glutamine---fructose-6-phosphate transaminase (isomerizing)
MCGILGRIGQNKSNPKELLQRLQRLEYRGYDAFGYTHISTGNFMTSKIVGKVSDYIYKVDDGVTFNTGICHTRWATHGKVNKVNTHPHISYDKEVYLVHNGVIENYQELQKLLQSKDISQVSETDSETVANLLAYRISEVINLKQVDIMDAIQTCLRQLQGSYALCFLVKSLPGKLFYAKSGSPLVIGKGSETNFISSDIYTFIDDTNRVLYLKDGDYGYITSKTCTRFNLDSANKKQNRYITIDAKYDAAALGNHEHYMIKEICEQKNIIQNTARALNTGKGANTLARKIKKSRRVIFTACGSSYYASLVGTNLLQEHGILCNNILSSEFESISNSLSEEDLVVCMSQSGETADIIHAIKIAKKYKCTVVGIVNVPNSTIDRESDMTIYLNAGPELCVLSTKSFTSQVAFLMLLWERMRGWPIPFGAIENAIYNLIASSTREVISTIAEELHEKDHIYCLGRGEQYPVALEAALKIKEVSYIHAEGFAGGELKHGSIALIEQGTPCILFVSEQHKYEILANGAELKARGATIIGIGSEDNELYDRFIRVDEFKQSCPILQIIPMQLLAYELALLRGLDPDKPRNLAKSVTVK